MPAHSPLALTLLDASVWRFRVPSGLEDDAKARLSREAIERYFEDEWILQSRHGLSADGLSPVEAARLAGSSRVLRRKLAAVVNMREAIAARPRSEPLYAGYPFDRLRRRLGLPPNDPDTIDPADVSCMSGAELQNLDLDVLDDSTLLEAFESAAAACDATILERFEAAIVARGLADQGKSP